MSTIYQVEIVKKTADVNLATDNTLNDDADIKIAMKVQEEWAFEVYAHYLAGAGGIKVAMSGPAAFAHLHYSANLDLAGATKVTSNVATAWDVLASSAGASQGFIRIVGRVHNGVNAGNLVFRWAQDTSNGANTTVYQGSHARFSRIL